VLQFYTQQQMGAAGGEYQQQSMPSLPAQGRTVSSSATRFEGVGLAGQQQAQRERLQDSEDRVTELEKERAREKETRERESQAQKQRERERSQPSVGVSRTLQRPEAPRAEVSCPWGSMRCD
jgi:protein-serine/threonine kinase